MRVTQRLKYPVSVSPTTLTIAEGESATARISGGNGVYSASASDNNTTATISGNIVTVSVGTGAEDGTVTITSDTGNTTTLTIDVA